MQKVTIGGDVSKDKIDFNVVDEQKNQLYRCCLDNTKAGHKALGKKIKQNQWQAHLVLEATGTYHVKMARYAHDQHIRVSVVNPLQIKRFCQMRLKQVKTDPVDAAMIALYGLAEQPAAWQPPTEAQSQIKQLATHIAQLIKQRTQTINLAHAHKQLAEGLSLCTKVTGQIIAHLDRQIAKLQKEQRRLVKLAYAKVYGHITSIKGLAERTATSLIACAGDLSGFACYKQLSSFIGLNPVVHQSGSSIYSKRGISKQGHSQLRTMLFMAAHSARIHNPACRRLYERLMAKGKPKKVARIAVANRLVKLAFTMVNQQQYYRDDYISPRSRVNEASPTCMPVSFAMQASKKIK